MVHGLYVEVEPVMAKYLCDKNIHVFYFLGGRGIGKTYGALDVCRKVWHKTSFLGKDTRKFMYMRRTAVEASAIASPEGNPFKKYNYDEGYDIWGDYGMKEGFGTIYSDHSEFAEKIGYTAALSTFANLRGIDFSDVDFILYDECLPENRNKHPLKEEGFLFLNMLETVNRNRALQGESEVVVCILSNCIDLGSIFLSQLNITSVLTNMIFKHQEKYTDVSRSLHIEKYEDHIVSQMKGEQSFLYKFAKGTGFNEQALSGKFINNNLDVVKKVNMNDYAPLLNIENTLTIYEKKSDSAYLYVSKVMTPAKYQFSVWEREKLRSVFYWRYKLSVYNSCVYYDDYQTKVVLDEMIRFKPL